MKVLLIGLIASSCMRVSGSTEHRVGGEAKVVHEVKVNLDSIKELCAKSLNEAQCITDVMSALVSNGILPAKEKGKGIPIVPYTKGKN